MPENLNYRCYSLQMQNWLDYLDIENKYNNQEIKKKCLLFIFLWLRYNESYNSKISRNIGDFQKALQLSESEICKEKYNVFKEQFLTSFKQINGADSPRTWILDIKNNRKIYYNSSSSLKDFLTVIYKIRCNIFHGDKPPNVTNIKIIAWAYDCFNQLLNECNYWNT